MRLKTVKSFCRSIIRKSEGQHRGSFGKHCQNQFQIAHVVPEVFFFQAVQVLVLPGCHTRPCAGNLVSQDCIFLSLFHNALLPLVCQLIAKCGLPGGAKEDLFISSRLVQYSSHYLQQTVQDAYREALPFPWGRCLYLRY